MNKANYKELDKSVKRDFVRKIQQRQNHKVERVSYIKLIASLMAFFAVLVSLLAIFGGK